MLLRPRSSSSSPSSLLPLVLFPVVALLPVVFIPSRRNERLPRRDARGPAPAGMRSRASGSARPLVTGGPCAGVRQSGSRRRRGREPAPGRRALPGPAPCAATGDLFAKAYETCGRRGAGALRPGVSTYSLPCRSPPMVRVFPAPIPGGALGPKARGGGFSCAGRHGEGQRLQGLRLLPASSGAGPDGPKRFNRHHHIDGRCHLDPLKMLGTLDPDVHRPGARPRGVRRWARTAGGRRATRPGPGVDPDATGGGHQVPPRRSAPAATGSHSRSSSARPNSWRHTARPGQYREPSLETGPGRSTSLFLNRPVPGRRCRTGALGAVAGTADAKACVRGAGSCACLLRPGCLSLFSAAPLPLPWFVRIPRRFREAR